MNVANVVIRIFYGNSNNEQVSEPCADFYVRRLRDKDERGSVSLSTLSSEQHQPTNTGKHCLPQVSIQICSIDIYLCIL